MPNPNANIGWNPWGAIEDPESLSNQMKLLRMDFITHTNKLGQDREIIKKDYKNIHKIVKEIYHFLLPDKTTDAMTLMQLRDGYKSRGWKIRHLKKEIKELKQ